MTTNTAGVECRQLHLAYGATVVLRDVSLAIEPGEFFALLGPSGSGKSTLLRLIAGFAQPQRGQLLIGGRDVVALPPWQRQVGMVFQNYALWPHLTVWDNVAFGLVERRMDKATIARKVGEGLELVGLAGLARRRPSQLSGGQQQRVALARTLVVEPQVLLLDEPLSNLDKALRVQMREELRAMQQRLGLTTIFVTHDQEEAMATAERMAVLDQGVLQQVGTPQALYDEPANAFVAGFVGTMNLLPARVLAAGVAGPTLELLGTEGPPVRWQLDAAAVPAGSEVLVSLRPHSVRIATSDAPAGAAALRLAGAVEAREFLGEFTRYRVRAGTHRLAVDDAHRLGAPGHAAGAPVVLEVDASQVRLLPG